MLLDSPLRVSHNFLGLGRINIGLLTVLKLFFSIIITFFFSKWCNLLSVKVYGSLSSGEDFAYDY